MPVNEAVLYVLAEIAITLAGFAGVVIAVWLQEGKRWSPTESRLLWFMLGDSLLVLLLALLPIPMVLANWSSSWIWGVSSALLGSWFLLGDLIALRYIRRERSGQQLPTVPVITSVLRIKIVVAFLLGLVFWLSALSLGLPRSQAFYVSGLILLLSFAIVEFLFFIGLMLRRQRRA